MIDCYLIALCRGSAVDEERKLFTLFALVEELRIPNYPSAKTQVELETQIYLEATSDELKKPIELRVVWCCDDGTEQTSDALTIELTHRRLRTRTQMTVLPPKPGFWKLHAEWKASGAPEWQRSKCGWPLDVYDAPPVSVAPPALAPTGAETP